MWVGYHRLSGSKQFPVCSCDGHREGIEEVPALPSQPQDGHGHSEQAGEGDMRLPVIEPSPATERSLVVSIGEVAGVTTRAAPDGGLVMQRFLQPDPAELCRRLRHRRVADLTLDLLVGSRLVSAGGGRLRDEFACVDRAASDRQRTNPARPRQTPVPPLSRCFR